MICYSLNPHNTNHPLIGNNHFALEMLHGLTGHMHLTTTGLPERIFSICLDIFMLIIYKYKQNTTHFCHRKECFIIFLQNISLMIQSQPHTAEPHSNKNSRYMGLPFTIWYCCSFQGFILIHFQVQVHLFIHILSYSNSLRAGKSLVRLPYFFLLTNPW